MFYFLFFFFFFLRFGFAVIFSGCAWLAAWFSLITSDPIRVFIIYQSGPVKNTEENAPPITPTINANANSLKEDTPQMNNANTITNVVKLVLIVRTNVLEILWFTSALISSLVRIVWSFRFSRIRSKITIVELIEYPMIVNIHAINVPPTDNLPTEYAANTTNTSLINAMIALDPNFTSLNRIAM